MGAADSAFQFLGLTAEITLLDLLLSGDNAVVIALACRGLPEAQKRQGLLLGALAAIGLRVVLTFGAGALLRVPLLRLLGGLALIVIAIQLVVEDEPSDSAERLPASLQWRPTGMSSAVRTIVVADLVMSLDNVLALAVVARGNALVLALGLLLSVPLLMAGGWYVGSLLVRYPFLVRLGGAMLGWFAGDIAASDAVYAGWVDQQSPALHVVVPALCAMYVVLQARIVDRARAAALTLRPVLPLASGLRAPRSFERDDRDRPSPEDVSDAGPLVADVATAGADAAVSIKEAAPRRRRLWSPRLAFAVGALVLAVGLVYWIVTMEWMPVSTTLARYDCSNNTTLYYTPGGQRIALAIGQTVVKGVILSDNQIDWGNLHSASMKLGTVPPTRILFASTRVLRVEGGFFAGVTCSGR
jgi:YjbE family integral membrane protein